MIYHIILFYDMNNNLIAEFYRLTGEKKFTAIRLGKWIPRIS